MIGNYYGKAVGILDRHRVTSSYINKCGHCRVRNVSKIEGKINLQYYHSFVAFILFLFIAANIVNIFFNRNVKDKRIKTKIFLLDLVKASLLLNYRSSLPPNPIPI